MCLGDREWSIGETPQCLPQGEVCPRQDSVSRTCYQECQLRSDCARKHVESCLCDGECGMSCQPVYVAGYCPDVELHEGAVVVSMTTRRIVYTSVVTLGCEERFEIEAGSTEITCLLNRTWSGQPIRCSRQATCENPPEIEGVRHDSWETHFYPGDELRYTCRPGYHGYVRGQTSSCQEDLSWTPVSLECYPISCGDPGYLRNGWREGNLFTFLSRVTFHCNVGYEMQGYPYRTCLSTQQWTSFLPSCVAIECPELTAPEHGSIQGRRFTYDSLVYFECETGYKLVGSGQRRCQGNKTWSGEEAICQVVACPEPGTPLHGSKISPRYNLNAIVRFSCNQGYRLFGSRTARCTEEETWSQPTPQCLGDCTVLNPPNGGYYRTSGRFDSYTAGDVVEHGTVIEIVCPSSYSLNSNAEYRCTNGQWSFDAQCVATPCFKLPTLRHGLVHYNPELVNQTVSTVPHQTQASYSCHFGFEWQGEQSSPLCHFGTWYYKASNPACTPKICSQDDLQHGRVSYTKDNDEFSVRNQDPHHGVTRMFKCSSGYSLVASPTEASVCIGGTWSTSLPSCGPDSCSAPSVASGDVEVQSLGHGGTAQVTCEWDRKPSVGTGLLRCHAGHWVPDGIRCIPRDAPSNVAFERPASQSSTSDGRHQASLAVDGDRTLSSGHGSCTVTRKSRGQHYWEVDLQATYRIEYVDIYTKRNKLAGTTVQVGYPDVSGESYRQCDVEIGSQTVGGHHAHVRVGCNPNVTAGQIVRIELPRSSRSLSLCEVEVFATGPIQTCRIRYIAGMRQTIKGENEVLPTNTEVPPGTRIDYSCEADYRQNGAVFNLCKEDSTWANADPSCDAAACEVQNPHNGMLNQRITSINHNRELAYSCNNGYEKENPVTRCEFGVLTPTPSCVERRCRFDLSGLSNILINNQDLEPDAEGFVYISHETNIEFSCKRGYELTNNNGNSPLCWRGELLYYTQVPSCQAVQCPDDPPYPTHGSIQLLQGTAYEHGSTIRYRCNSGYQIQDPTTEYSHCDNGRWSVATPPVCQPESPVTEAPVAAATCPTPLHRDSLIYYRGQNIATAGFEVIFANGDEIELRCGQDFAVNGRTELISTCVNGAWTPKLSPCEVQYKRSCSRPREILNVRQYVNDKVKLLDSPRTLFYDKSTIKSRCQDPFKMRLSIGSVRTCDNGRWTGPVPRCVMTTTSFRIPTLGSTIHQFMANGTLLIFPGVGQLTVECIVPLGFSLLEHSHSQPWVPVGSGRKMYGTPAGSHSGTYTCKILGLPISHQLEIQVRAVVCPEPRPILNGRRIGDDFNLTKTVSFECNEGYDLIGKRTVQCNLGEWLGDMPHCRARDCPAINRADLDPNLDLVINGGSSSGSVAVFACRSGFHRVGETHLTCRGGRWSPSFPTCEADVADDIGLPDDCNCEVWERCVANSDGPSTCHCIHPQQCDDDAGAPGLYCGSDGRTYPSICKMKAGGCLLDLDVEVVSLGPCPEVAGDPSEAASQSYYPSESFESSFDSFQSQMPTDGGDMVTAADHFNI